MKTSQNTYQLSPEARKRARQLARQAPPLSRNQRDKLARLLRPVR